MDYSNSFKQVILAMVSEKEHENSVFFKLKERLSATNIEVFLEDRGVLQQRNTYKPDIVLKRGDEVIAVIEVKGEIAFREHSNYSTWLKLYTDKLQDNYKSALFVITDGNRFLYDYLGIVEIVSSFDIFIKLILERDSTPYTVVSTSTYYKDLQEIIKEYDIKNRGLLDWIKGLDEKNSFEENGVSVRFSSVELENQFFLNLVGSVSDNQFCRYTSLNSLFTILEKQEQNMCSLVCMNDKGELYYVDDRVSMPYSSVPDNPNDCFILSLLPISHRDELTFWRLYGCDASGVCITYEVGKALKERRATGFYIAKVSYEQEDGCHPELDLINRLVSIGFKSRKVFTFRNWYIWKHFFKSHHFAVEDEVRLLYIPPKDSTAEVKWIRNEANLIVSKMLLFDLMAKTTHSKKQFPMTIEHVFIGPKITESQVIEQYDYMRSSNLSSIRAIEPSSIQDIYR